MNDSLLRRATDQIGIGNRAEARRLLSQLVQQDPHNLEAWRLLSELVDAPDQRAYCLQKVAELEKVAAPQPAPPATKLCPFCKTQIPAAAVQCPNCTQSLQASHHAGELISQIGCLLMALPCLAIACYFAYVLMSE